MAERPTPGCQMHCRGAYACYPGHHNRVGRSVLRHQVSAGTSSSEQPMQQLRGRARQLALNAWAAALQGCRWVHSQLGMAGRLHLGLFYCFGLYYSWAKRLTGALLSADVQGCAAPLCSGLSRMTVPFAISHDCVKPMSRSGALLLSRCVLDGSAWQAPRAHRGILACSLAHAQQWPCRAQQDTDVSQKRCIFLS